MNQLLLLIVIGCTIPPCILSRPNYEYYDLDDYYLTGEKLQEIVQVSSKSDSRVKTAEKVAAEVAAASLKHSTEVTSSLSSPEMTYETQKVCI